ncbi:MAG: preprotein translocase subunit YajC [Clostridiales bacterium]|nr:preprotein translocase subunit YajC [Clostridiales bacterium]
MLLTAAAGAPEAGAAGLIATFFPFILMIVVFYFFIIRPQRKREKENREMLANLAVGDNITTIGGICGKIVAIREDIITVEVGVDKVKLVFERWAVRSVDKITAD